MLQNREKVCVILGAGASFDVRGVGTANDPIAYRPPLANSLFDTQNQRFWAIMEPYTGARYIANLLPTQLKRKGGLEECLRYFAYESDDATKRQYLHVPPYLRDLLYLCGYQYTPDPGSYIALVHELLAERSYEVLFLILNYDNLLERALTHYDPTAYSFTELGQYIEPHRAAKVVKLHGSINWFRSVTKNPNEPWEAAILAEDVLSKIPDSEIMVIDQVEYTATPRRGHWLYPILTAPLAGKGISDVVCPRSHFEFAEGFLKECKNYLVIGTSGFDIDLLDLMGESIPPNEFHFVHFIGQDTNPTKESLVRFQAKVEAFHRGKTNVIEFAKGFRNYLESDLRGFSERDITEYVP